MLEQLTDQVGELVLRLEELRGTLPQAAEKESAFCFSERADTTNSSAGDHTVRLIRQARSPLPEARCVRRILYRRGLRTKYFGSRLFADPAWDMLLDLAAAHAENKRVSVSSLCIASGVPPTTALRWINEMIAGGWLVRRQDELDRRRAFVELSDRAMRALADYFAEIAAR
mgnify:CR=1 FL=1